MKDVVVIVESSTQYGRNLLVGIANYATLHNWRLQYEQRGILDPEPVWLNKWQGDGIIVRHPDPRISKNKAKQGVAVLDMFYEIDSQSRKGIIVDSDHYAVGKLAAEHLMGKGHRSFGYIGFAESVFSRYRQLGYEETLLGSGLECLSFVNPDHNKTDQARWVFRQREFVKTLPFSCALYCATDELAFAACNDCIQAGISVPEQVAILGTDNDTVLCEMMSPTLSSIDPDIPQLGWQAAARLDQMMKGEDPLDQGDPQVVQPKGIIVRQSTARFAVEDPNLAKALEEIRRTACMGASVDDIATSCHMSRRNLERCMSKQLGKTVKSLIVEVQVNRAKKLLLQTDYTLDRIAELIGMNYTERLSYMFKRQVGMTPGKYRKQSGK